MKNQIIAFLVLVSNINVSTAQISDFRGFMWGKSITEVEKDEKAQLLKKVGNDELVYKDVLASSDCDALFIFNDNDKLESGMYVFTKKYSNPQLYIQDYNKFKKLLTEKYGNPLPEKDIPNHEKQDTDYHNYGQAIADGNLQLHTVWSTDRTVIKITLITIDKQPNLQIHYTARSLDELENKEELKDAVKKL